MPRAECRDPFEKIEQRIARMEVRLIRWMFVFWASSMATMIALNKL